jgi:hypothetical protein
MNTAVASAWGHNQTVLILPRETCDKAWARLRPMVWRHFRLCPDLTMWFNRKFVIESTLKEFKAAEAARKAKNLMLRIGSNAQKIWERFLRATLFKGFP